MHESHYSAMLKETLVIFRIWLINKPHFHLLPKGERIAVILLIAHTAPYVWTLNSCKVGWKKQRQNETFLLSLSLSFQAQILQWIIFMVDLIVSFNRVQESTNDYKADLCVYSGFKSDQAFQGFVLLTQKTTAFFGTEILGLPNSLSPLLTNFWNCACYMYFCDHNVSHFLLVF